MAGIAGVAGPGKTDEVGRMLDALAHRGRDIRDIFEMDGITLGATAPSHQTTAISRLHNTVRDYAGYGHYAQARVVRGELLLDRDPLGVAPLYYGRTPDAVLCFASEVKALVNLTHTVTEILPGSIYDGQNTVFHHRLHLGQPTEESAERIALELKSRLCAAAERCVTTETFGAWLSGGLDSSALVAVARPYTHTLHTFAGGVEGAPDLEFARQVANFVGTRHHETVIALPDMLRALPEVIFHLESFDTFLVRSSIINFLVGKQAAEHVPAVLSGEGGDELFAGYEYLKALPREQLADELLDIAGRLHNTALQRVDRCASAHGLVAHTCFLDPPVVELAMRIPVDLKLRDNVEKWILRQALKGMLPKCVLERTKAKFWQGAGVGELLAEHADETITTDDFRRERQLANGWTLDTKEELLYYRIFKEKYGNLEKLDWMGRTKKPTDT